MEFQNVTVVLQAEFFGLAAVLCKTLRIEHRPYAQYPRATSLRWRGPRQRKDRGKVLAYDQQMVVFRSMGGIELDNFEDVSAEHGLKVQRGKHSACSTEWAGELDALADRYKDRVLYAQNRAGDAQGDV